MSSQILLSGGDKWYSYSGMQVGDVSVPASIQLMLIPNTGLRDSYLVIQPVYGKEVASASGSQLGIEVKLDDVTIIKSQNLTYAIYELGAFNLFVPRQSKLEIISINESANNTQERGANVIGYYL